MSDACTDICKHRENALVHHVGDVKALTNHITMLHQDRSLLENLRRQGLSIGPTVTWQAAGLKLLDAYRAILGMPFSHETSKLNEACVM